MIKKERLTTILNLINTNNIMTAKELSKQLNVSIMTINRDLNELEAEGLINKVYGGATSVEYNRSKFSSFNKNKEIHIDEKYAVAKKAAEQIENEDIIFIGPGTTNELILDFIAAQNVTVVTSNIAIFDKLRNSSGIQVIIVGGEYNKKSNSVTGVLAEKMITDLQFDKCFIGINGIDHLAATTLNADAGKLQSIALSNSHKRYIVTDKYKLDKKTFFEFYTLKPGDTIITNSSIKGATKKYYEHKVNLLLN
ncbi:DeoR/GlpR family DNA-binding transcription regulator [Pediococcus acidilactici]|jgi:DeoR family lactose phosphotransferase system repressor|uniref:DeoR/GlpR family DNA-binding transcription regulator n=1 Tax=Pediococcus acidilactici TaxID=1254 RepID=UPI001898B8F0|nr:DeoR/GlpR family DNA-binding transcription regulator [Pediococcus acidilactici]